MQVLDLFSGIGGFSLGLERAGMKTVAFCEIDKKARQVLAKHWPDVPIFTDVKTLTKAKLDEHGISVDVICGGFPCQDISLAGKGAGIEGKRSGLWSEFARLIGEVRPRYAIVENVSALLNRGIDRVLGDLASLGYDAEWHCIPASAIGAPHRRDRIWILAYPNLDSARVMEGRGSGFDDCADGIKSGRVPDYDAGSESKTKREILAHAHGAECQAFNTQPVRDEKSGEGNGRLTRDGVFPNANIEGLQGDERSWTAGTQGQSIRHITECSWWEFEPNVGRVANGVPGRVDRLKQLGNAVVPQIPEMIGRAIMSC